MKRDMDLIRLILIEMEKSTTYPSIQNLEINGYSEGEVHFHLMLLKEAGLIIAENVSAQNDLYLIPDRLTWQGYEFLEATKNNDAWNKTKEIMAKSGGFVFEVGKSILIKILAQQLGSNL